MREGGIDLGLKFVIQDRPVVVKMGEKVCSLFTVQSLCYIPLSLHIAR